MNKILKKRDIREAKFSVQRKCKISILLEANLLTQIKQGQTGANLLIRRKEWKRQTKNRQTNKLTEIWKDNKIEKSLPYNTTTIKLYKKPTLKVKTVKLKDAPVTDKNCIFLKFRFKAKYIV